MQDTPQHSTQTTARITRADEYFNVHLKGQRDWYSKKAATNKNWGGRLSVLVIACGTLIPVVQIFATDTSNLWVSLGTAALGVIITLAKGIDRIAKFEETWMAYRKASECMKREYRLYINNAGAYSTIEGEDQAYRYFVLRVEGIIAEEQNIFWQDRDTTNQQKEGEPAGDLQESV